MKPVELVTVSLWHFSVGDFAILQGTLKVLSEAGVPTIPASRSSGKYCCVVGGGYYYGGNWPPLLEHFMMKGPHILNAIGMRIDRKIDYSFFKEWSYLSARDSESAAIIRKYVNQQVYEVPCSAMYVKPLSWDVLLANPRFEFLKDYTPGKYIVVDVDEALALWSDQFEHVIPVDTRPWLRRTWTGRHKPAPVTHSAEIVMTIIANAKAVIARSLHLGIFALTVGTDFVVYDIEDNPSDPNIYKSFRYWKRASFKEVVYHGNDPLGAALKLSTKLLEIRKQEFFKLHDHIKRIVSVCSRQR
ncbi:MAG: polysaccharide pyruvyl transferase family protein [Candidatus Omnitrophota bacterium]|nr:polysaccharide pyruvyl transferase family protein [Candidatus Omnitrophota bacterium]